MTKIGTTNCVRGEVTAPRWGSRIDGWGFGNRCVGTIAPRWCSSITVTVATTAPPTLGLDNRRLVNHRFPCRVSRIATRDSRIAISVGQIGDSQTSLARIAVKYVRVLRVYVCSLKMSPTLHCMRDNNYTATERNTVTEPYSWIENGDNE